ncbi:hypothetical protein E1212_14105 [Jiangella ureilytica]|uniref:NodB homology domain-containing protein n=1 Tax=Jiangella ureilytica TaxID=2530374 RepID=A0A4R4RPQ5_9ACTN|nr:hypothetical protein [Jiangella ureilytica]TDC50692.1 hypothetical protein E1212_14105 [Jiangella ureilytica]
MIRILTDPKHADAARREGRDVWSAPAAAEALAILGVPATVHDGLPMIDDGRRLPLLVVDEPDPDTAAALLDHADSGGAFVVCGHDPSWTGLTATPAPAEALVHVDAQLTSDGEPLRLRAFGGWALTVPGGDVVGASWEHDRSPAIVRVARGRGTVAVVGPDLWHTLVRITQGHRVDGDGVAPADGSAPVDDGLLKCDDGIALSWTEDRTTVDGVPADETYEHVHPPTRSLPFFAAAQADQWREILLHLLLDLTGDDVLPLVAPWPDGAPAAAHVSHDSDANDDPSARAALDCFAAAGIAVTWCFLYPGGYSQEIYDEVVAAGHEPALHYNAMLDTPDCTWGLDRLREQLAWATHQVRGAPIVTNKNHFTRWEGWDEFFLWCEDLGLRVDQSHGPSVQGAIGFPFGTCHPHRPLTSAAHGNRPVDVLDLPLQTQDLWLTCTLEVRDAFVAEALRRHGLVHLLFHGQHLQHHVEVRTALAETVHRLRAAGVAFHTSAALADWSERRRQLRLRTTTTDDGAVTVTVEGGRDVDGVALLVPAHLRPYGDGDRHQRVVRYGRTFTQVVLDGRSVRLVPA